MITYEKFITNVELCSPSEFEIIKQQAKNKLARIIELFGDENGERLTDRYLVQLMREELRAKRVSDQLFMNYLSQERVCPVTA